MSPSTSTSSSKAHPMRSAHRLVLLICALALIGRGYGAAVPSYDLRGKEIVDRAGRGGVDVPEARLRVMKGRKPVLYQSSEARPGRLVSDEDANQVYPDGQHDPHDHNGEYQDDGDDEYDYESESPYQYMYGYELGVPVVLPRSDGQGWLSRWLSMGGEGSVTVHLNDSSPAHLSNVTLPHRPAAFPAHITNPLPVSGYIVPFSSLPPLEPDHDYDQASSEPTSSSSTLSLSASATDAQRPEPSQRTRDEFACLPPRSPIGRPLPPARGPFKIVLVERGRCDFATKVRAAQERGAGAVVVGDGVARKGETEEEGRRRESLITMFSPEDTESISIPSVFVSRASYLLLRDLLANHTDSGRAVGSGLWVDLSQGSDETGALTSLLSFALLMPSIFLLATIAVHRIRVARQREADRAPPMVVLSLPERIWTPDIVWEKDDSASERSIKLTGDADPLNPDPEIGTSPRSTHSRPIASAPTSPLEQEASSSTPTFHHPPPPISPSEVRTPPPIDDAPEPDHQLDQAHAETHKSPSPGVGSSKPRRKRRRYFSKDECAICMDSFERGDIVRILPCGHVFHKDECDEWLMKWRKLCPTCRADVTLPTGGTVKGSTLTPVTHTADRAHSPTNPLAEHEDDVDPGSGWGWGRSTLSGARRVYDSARERVREGYLAFGGARAQNEEGEGERTPLVPARSRSRSG